MTGLTYQVQDTLTPEQLAILQPDALDTLVDAFYALGRAIFAILLPPINRAIAAMNSLLGQTPDHKPDYTLGA